MQSAIRLIVFAAVCLTFYILPANGQTPTPEIPDPTFNDIAAVFPDARTPTGAVIIYNPNICNQIGAACGFFRVHEHCHVSLGHQFLGPRIHPVARERDADRCAAANAGSANVVAAYLLFRAGGSSSNWHTYGTPLQRARRLCLFAKQANNWAGPPNCG